MHDQDQLTPSQLLRLVRLNRQICKVLGFDAVPKRDAVTGAFTTAGTLTGKSVRSAWGLAGVRPDPGRAAFKTQLLAALRASRK